MYEYNINTHTIIIIIIIGEFIYYCQNIYNRRKSNEENLIKKYQIKITYIRSIDFESLFLILRLCFFTEYFETISENILKYRDD